MKKENLKDKKWRINHLYKIIDKAGNKINFKRNYAQEHFNQNKHSRNIILKSRQLGFTTDECIDSLDDVLWIPNFKGLFISYDKDSATEIFDDKIKLAWDNYPESLAQLYKVESDSVNKLKFDFGDNTNSSIIVRNKGRSGTFQRVHISEFAKICKESPRKAKEIVAGTIPAVPDNGRVDIESTAEGEDGLFHDMFWEAWDRQRSPLETEFKAHFYNWQWEKDEINNTEIIPIEEMEDGDKFRAYRDKLAREDNINLTDKELTFYYKKWLSLGRKWYYLQQEYPTTPEEAFVSSGNKLFDKESVLKQKEFIVDGNQVGNWIYFEEYISGHTYCLGGDVSHGKGLDSSTIVILDLTPIKPKVVAEYACNTISPDNFAYEIKSGAEKYGNCLAGVENNDRGHTTLTTLKSIYHNIYKMVKTNRQTDRQTDELGWNTNGATKPKMMFDLSTAVRDELIEIPSRRIITEARTYSEDDLNNIKFNEEQTKHWDLLIALAIAYQMRTKVSSSANQFKNINKQFI